MQKAIGQPVLYESHGLQFVCVVRDVKVGYGKPRFLITPMTGKGETWVEYATISPMPKDKNTLHHAVRTNTSQGYAAIPSGQNGMVVR